MYLSTYKSNWHLSKSAFQAACMGVFGLRPHCPSSYPTPMHVPLPVSLLSLCYVLKPLRTHFILAVDTVIRPQGNFLAEWPSMCNPLSKRIEEGKILSHKDANKIICSLQIGVTESELSSPFWNWVPAVKYFSDDDSRSLNSQFSSVQSLSRVRLFTTPWIPARQASLSITNSRSSPKLM